MIPFVRAGLLAVATCSCSGSSDPVSKCEALLLQGLKAPASYNRISELVGLDERGTQSVFLTYDAVNSYNAPIRSVFSCEFNPATGSARKADGTADLAADNLDIPPDNLATPTADGALDAAPPTERNNMATAPVGLDYEEDEVPVCDRPDSASKRELMNEIGVDCTGE